MSEDNMPDTGSGEEKSVPMNGEEAQLAPDEVFEVPDYDTELGKLAGMTVEKIVKEVRLYGAPITQEMVQQLLAMLVNTYFRRLFFNFIALSGVKSIFEILDQERDIDAIAKSYIDAYTNAASSLSVSKTGGKNDNDNLSFN